MKKHIDWKRVKEMIIPSLILLIPTFFFSPLISEKYNLLSRFSISVGMSVFATIIITLFISMADNEFFYHNGTEDKQ